MNTLLILPIIFPFVLGMVTLLTWRFSKTQELINLAGSFVYMVIGFLLVREVLAGGILHVQAGSWIAPFGITLVADTFSAVMVMITCVMSFAVSLYSVSSMKSGVRVQCDMVRKRRQFAYYPLLNIMYMGICGAFMTGDLFNMYVWFEVMLISSFILLSLDGTREQLEATFKYVTINLISSAFFLIGIGFVYGLTGSLNMADVAIKMQQVENQSLVTLVSMFFLICFGIKAAVFPLFFWLPASYHTPPISITAIFGAMLTKVGVYSLMRVFTLIFINDVGYTHTILLWIGGFTMLVGVLGAASQYDMRRLLSFHIISQIGYMIMGLALYTPLAIAGGVFYIIHNILAKGNLFLIAGVVNRLRGTYDIRKIGNLVTAYPLLAVLFLVSALALAGIPPLTGFWGKFYVVKAGLQSKEYLFVVVALVVGMLTLFSMIKIWNEAFWKKQPDNNPSYDHCYQGLFSKHNIFMTIPIIMMALSTIIIGFFPEPFFHIAERAASELLNPDIYIQTILGGAQ